MKKINYSVAAKDNAKKALDQVESAFAVKTGLKAGGNAYGHGNPRNPHNDDPIVQPLYGVVIEPV